jgi:hypothetical protein
MRQRHPFFKVALFVGGVLIRTPLKKISTLRYAFLREISEQFIGRSINQVLLIGSPERDLGEERPKTVFEPDEK